jgi:hypothetical protein
MTRTCQKEKQSVRTVQPKTLRAKGDKKRRLKPERIFFGKKSTCVSRRLGVRNDNARSEEQRAMFVSRSRATKGKTSPKLHAKETVFRANSISECSACPSGLLTYIIYPCTPLPSASRRQLAPSAPSPLVAKLIHAAVALSIAAESAATARSTCPGCPVPDTFCVAAAAAALFPLSPATHTSAAARGPCPGYPALRRRCRHSRSCINPTAEQTPAALPGTSTPYWLPRPPPPPPRETSRLFFFYSPSYPAGNRAYQHSIFVNCIITQYFLQ